MSKEPTNTRYNPIGNHNIRYITYWYFTHQYTWTFNKKSESSSRNSSQSN